MTSSISLLAPRGNSISVFAAGQGPALMLLHGFPLDHRQWVDQLRDLATRFHVIVPELRGFGKSTLTEVPYSLADLADDVEFVRQRLCGQQRMHLCGLSMGGYVAFEYLARFAAGLHSVVLTNTKPTADTDEARQGRLDMARHAEQAGGWAAVSGMLPKLLGASTREKRPQVVEATEAMLRSAPGAAVSAAQQAMAARHDFTPSLVGFDLPTLVIAGAEDVICPPDATQAWASHIPSARYEVIADAGHLTPMEAPERFNDVLTKFLGGESMESNNEFDDPFQLSLKDSSYLRETWWHKNRPLLVLVAIALICNVCLPGMFWNAPHDSMWMLLALAADGALCAEIVMLGAWLGLGGGSLPSRIAYTVPLMAMACITFLIGLRWAEAGLPVVVAAFILGIGSIGFAIASGLHWLLRYGGHWVLTRRAVAPAAEATRFSIGYLLAATGFVAGLVAVLKVVLRSDTGLFGPGVDESGLMALLCLHQAVSVLLIYAPCFWWALSARLLALAVAAAALLCVPYMNVWILAQYSNGIINFDILRYTYCFSSGFALAIAAAGWMVRYAGFRLRRLRTLDAPHAVLPVAMPIRRG